jgi:hypothetical protein
MPLLGAFGHVCTNAPPLLYKSPFAPFASFIHLSPEAGGWMPVVGVSHLTGAVTVTGDDTFSVLRPVAFFARTLYVCCDPGSTLS